MLKVFGIFLFIFLLTSVSPTESANVLAIFPSPSPSHLIIDMAVANALAEREHNVTLLTVLPLKSSAIHPNITHIQLSSGLANIEAIVRGSQNMTGIFGVLSMMFSIKAMASTVADTLNDPALLNLLQNDGNKFELFISGYFFTDYLFGIAAHFGCSTALIWPNQPMSQIMSLIGNPIEITHTSVSFRSTSNTEIDLKFRFINLISAIAMELMLTPMNIWMKSVYDAHFPADKYPTFREAKQNVAIAFYAHHFSEKPVRALVPGFIEIGGIQLNDEPNQLPKDIEAFLNDATTHGAIFISLGTNVRKEYLEPDTLGKLFNVFSKLPQKIVWKCDDADVPSNSSNILFKNWVPQADILAHPNVRLFFNHGGKGGITEAIYNGVPMVGLPLFGDQPTNLEEVTKKGYGVAITNFKTMTEADIEWAIAEVLENPSYRTEIQRFSKVYRDRPMSPKDTAVYWLEYVIRHKGAPHMQSPLKSLSFIEANNIDLLLFFIVITILLVKMTKKAVSIVRKVLKKYKKEKLN